MSSGELLSHLVLGMPAPLTTGQLRVSHRETDPERSTPAEPFHPHVREQLLSDGEIVSVPLGLWATSVRFHAGQQLRLTIAGHRIAPFELNMPSDMPLRNHGQHVLHLGGSTDSHLLVPLIALDPGRDTGA